MNGGEIFTRLDSIWRWLLVFGIWYKQDNSWRKFNFLQKSRSSNDHFEQEKWVFRKTYRKDFEFYSESDVLQSMAAERIENITETTKGPKRKALFYINGKFDTATQKFVSRVWFGRGPGLEPIGPDSNQTGLFVDSWFSGFSDDSFSMNQIDDIEPVLSLSHGKPLTYLPWLKLSGSLPYPLISNATKTRITWDFKRNKHKVYAYPARWQIISGNGTSNSTLERKYHQFCRNKVNFPTKSLTRNFIGISE